MRGKSAVAVGTRSPSPAANRSPPSSSSPTRAAPPASASAGVSPAAVTRLRHAEGGGGGGSFGHKGAAEILAELTGNQVNLADIGVPVVPGAVTPKVCLGCGEDTVIPGSRSAQQLGKTSWKHLRCQLMCSVCQRPIIDGERIVLRSGGSSALHEQCRRKMSNSPANSPAMATRARGQGSMSKAAKLFGADPRGAEKGAQPSFLMQAVDSITAVPGQGLGTTQSSAGPRGASAQAQAQARNAARASTVSYAAEQAEALTRLRADAEAKRLIFDKERYEKLVEEFNGLTIEQAEFPDPLEVAELLGLPIVIDATKTVGMDSVVGSKIQRDMFGKEKEAIVVKHREEVARLEEVKRQCIQREDYVAAQKAKEQIEAADRILGSRLAQITSAQDYAAKELGVFAVDQPESRAVDQERIVRSTSNASIGNVNSDGEGAAVKVFMRTASSGVSRQVALSTTHTGRDFISAAVAKLGSASSDTALVALLELWECPHDPTKKERRIEHDEHVAEARKNWPSPDACVYVLKLQRGTPGDMQMRFRELCGMA